MPDACKPRILLLATALLLSACQGTQQPPATDDKTAYDGSYNPIARSLEFQLETPSGTLSPILLVATEIQWVSNSGQLRALVSLRNEGRETFPGPFGVAVYDFVPQHVSPVNADCSTNDPPSELRPCVFVHQDTYGDDGVLSPGETSVPVLWMVQDTPGVSFSFRARLIPESPGNGGLISGVVYDDRNRSGVRDRGEPGIADITVTLQLGNSKDPVELVQRTDPSGRYEFRVSRAGVYPLRKAAARGWEPTTPTEMQVFVVETSEGTFSDFTQGDFGCSRTEGAGVYGSVYLDRNRNGERDDAEPGVAGVEVTAWGLECDSPGFGVSKTDENGNYRIAAADIGCRLPWFVQRAEVAGMIGTTPKERRLESPPDDDASFHTTFGVAPLEVDPPRVWLTIVGVVFDDLDGNGQRDLREPGVSGVPIALLSPCEVPTLPTYTNPRGEYRFEPHETDFCPISGVHHGVPDNSTTPNPVEITTPSVPGFHKLSIDFGVHARGIQLDRR